MADVNEPTAPADPAAHAAEPPSCPLLGLPDDEHSRFSFPSVAHRCHADSRRRPIELGHQATFCLVAAYPACPWYRAAEPAPRPGVAATVRTTGVTVEPVRTSPGELFAPGWAAAPGRAADTSARPDAPGRPGASGTTRGGGRRPPGRASRWRHLVAVVLAGAVLVGALWLASPGVVDWMRHLGTGAGAASPSPSAPPPASTATPAPGATPTASPAATASRAPGATSTPSAATPAPTATTARTAAPAATPLVHVVVWGETLFAIAAKYGVPMASIAKANGLTDPGLIYPGQHLVIPAQ